MAIELNIIAEIEAEMKRAAAKASGGNASFFTLKAGEKALVRPLLNLNAIASILKHDYYNPTTQKYEVDALCSETPALDLPGTCKHCQVAKATNNKKLAAIKFFVIPVWVYQIKNATGAVVNYTDQEGVEKPVSGVRYLSLKVSSDILATLLVMWKEGADITASDLVIIRTGEKLETKYTVLPRPPKPFSVENVPAQSAEAIIMRIADLNPMELIGSTNNPSTDTSPVQQPVKAGKVNDVPDF